MKEIIKDKCKRYLWGRGSSPNNDNTDNDVYTLNFPISRVLNVGVGVPGRLSQLSIRLLISAQVMIPQFMRWSCTAGSALMVWSLLGILSLSLSTLHPLMSSLKINKQTFFLKKKIVIWLKVIITLFFLCWYTWGIVLFYRLKNFSISFIFRLFW